MSWKGGFAAGDTVDFKFTTRRFNTGVPFTLAGTPAVSVYKSNSTTQSTSGITLTVDFDSVTGLNHVRIDTTSDGTFYANGSQFDVVITAGTVDSVSVVGEAIGRFELRAALSTLDAAGVRAAVGLASANLDTQLSTIDDFLDTEVAAIKTKTDFLPSATAGAAGGLFIAGTNAATSITTALTANIIGNVTGNLSGSVGSVTGLTASNLDVAVSTRLASSSYTAPDNAGIAAVKAKTDNLPTDPADASDIAASFSTVNGTLSTIAAYVDTEVSAIKAVTDKLDDTMEDAGSDGFIFSALALSQAPSTGGDPWSTLLPGAYGAGTAGKIVGDALDAAISTRATPAQVAGELATYDGPTNADLATALAAADDAVLAAIGGIPTATENADALLNRDMSAVSDTNDRSPLNALRFLRNKWVLTSSTLSVKKENDVTEAWTAEVTTTPGADPISGSDPA